MFFKKRILYAFHCAYFAGARKFYCWIIVMMNGFSVSCVRKSNPNVKCECIQFSWPIITMLLGFRIPFPAKSSRNLKTDDFQYVQSMMLFNPWWVQSRCCIDWLLSRLLSLSSSAFSVFWRTRKSVSIDVNTRNFYRANMVFCIAGTTMWTESM